MQSKYSYQPHSVIYLGKQNIEGYFQGLIWRKNLESQFFRVWDFCLALVWFSGEVVGLSTLDRLEVIILIVEVRWSPPAFQHHTTHNTTEHKKSFQIQRMWFVYLSKSSFYRAMISPSHIGRFFPAAPQSILKGECKVCYQFLNFDIKWV